MTALRVRTDLGAGVRVVLGLALLGALLGLIWMLVLPPPPRAPDSPNWFQAVASFALIGFVTGLATGLLSWWWRSWRGVVVLLAVVLGSLLSAAVAGAVGSLAAPGVALTWAVVLCQPFGAALAYAVAVGFSTHDDLGRADARVIGVERGGPGGFGG